VLGRQLGFPPSAIFQPTEPPVHHAGLDAEQSLRRALEHQTLMENAEGVMRRCPDALDVLGR
jgi:hypothetical protein